MGENWLEVGDAARLEQAEQKSRAQTAHHGGESLEEELLRFFHGTHGFRHIHKPEGDNPDPSVWGGQVIITQWPYRHHGLRDRKFMDAVVYDKDKGIHCAVECKEQNTNGTTYEKLFCTKEHLLETGLPQAAILADFNAGVVPRNFLPWVAGRLRAEPGRRLCLVESIESLWEWMQP